ncbi:MAG: phage/plasmid primase, P4 family [Bacteroides fragilis]|nr:phage/plasmid primase, P4 family [Bacteroides fragilis]
MDNNIIKHSDYIKADRMEELAGQESKEVLLELQERNRGISYLESGKVTINARNFAEYVLSRISLFRLDSNQRIIMNQVTKVYEPVSEVVLTKVCMSIMDEYSSEYYMYVVESRVLGFIDKLANTYKRIETDNRYILFPNGFYDTQTFTFDSQFKTKAVLTYQMGFGYDDTADCPEWKKALSKMFPDDSQAVIGVVQEIFGYTFLYGEAPADMLFYFWGHGRNGKSIISNVLKALHGVENIAGVPLAELGEGFNLSAIYNKKLCICPENAQEKLLDTSTLKALTGRDAVKVEKKYENPFTTTISTKIIVNSNHYLRTDDASVGFWERILPIPFEVTFIPKKEWAERARTPYFRVRDIHLEKRLQAELSGIFNWSMQGLVRLKANGWVFTKSEKIKDLKNKMMMYCKPVTAFVIQCVTQGNKDKQNGKTDRIQSSRVHYKFLAWAEDKMLEVTEYHNARRFRQAFTESLKEQGIMVDIVKNSVDVYVGIIVKKL